MGVVLVLLGIVGLALSLWVVAVGHLPWARIGSRRGGALLAAGSLALFVAGGAVSESTSTSTSTAAGTADRPQASRPDSASVHEPTPARRPTAVPVAARPAAVTPPAPTTRRAATAATAATAAPAAHPAASTESAPSAGSADAVLLTLAVKGRAPKTGYSREQFGPSWADVAHDGCDTRNDILRRDLTGVTVVAGTGGCEVLTGSLADPYSGTTIGFTRGENTSALVQIDHVVPLSNAWQTGAAGWSAMTREDFANDPLNLLAVDGSLNEQKSDGDAATWLPPNRAERCAYVARQVAVKARYRLWVTPPEKVAITRILTGCPGQRLPTEAAATAPAPNPDAPAGQERSAPAPTTIETTTRSAGLDPRFPTCKAAKAAGYGPYREGIDPEYAWYTDADHDGIDCE